MKKYLVGILLIMSSVVGYSTTFTVTLLGDANTGAGTSGDIRYCMNQASNVAGVHTINFNLPTAPYIIILNSPLNLYGAGTTITIDATTQPGWVGNPIVVVRGNGGVADGIQVNNGTSHQIKGLAFQNLTLNGIVINSGTNHIIENCYFGIGTDGTTSAGNALTEYGILVRGSSTGNRIGNTPNATATRNVISNCLKGGIRLENNCNTNSIQGNYIGTNATASAAIPNGSFDQDHAGVYVDNANNLSIRNNIISGNKGCGIRMVNGNSFNSIITGNFIGTDIAGTAAISNTGGGIRIEGSNNHTIGGSTVADRNLISANGGAPHGAGLTQYDRSLQCGIFFNNVNSSSISGNYIGIDISGVAAPFAMGNLYCGIKLEGNCSGNTIGGANTSFRNIIGGNGYKEVTVGVQGYRGHGIQLNGSNVINTTITANYIGIGSDGTSNIGNRQDGISILGARNNTIGGNNSNLKNVISDNCWGIFIQSNFGGGQASGNIIIGNNIGTDANGTIAKGNGTRAIDTDEGAGIGIQHGSNGNFIGRNNAGEGNIISGNKAGIIFRSSGFGTANANFVYNNYIGLDAAGNALQNAGAGTTNANYYGNGVAIGGGCFNNTIGGTLALQRNYISGNAQNGVHIEIGAQNTVRGNYIGTNIAGTAAVPNGAAGINIINVSASAITQTIVDANIIAGNTNNGIMLNAATFSLITGNTIGMNVTGMAAIPNGGYGIWAVTSSTNNIIGGTAGATTRNIISGHSAHGIYIVNSNSNSIFGNYIGLRSDGTASVASRNGGNGISIANSTGTMVGGATAGQGNVISNNGFTALTASGVSFSGGSNNTSVINNIIGLEANGTTAAGNSDFGIWGFNNVTGPTSITGNTTAANGFGTNSGSGIYLGDCANATVTGNTSGLNSAGTAVPNRLHGLHLGGSTVATVGGTSAATRNILSGNTEYGLVIETSSGNTVQGNSVGTDAIGTGVKGNGLGGINIISNAASNIIGGVAANQLNLIAYNTGNGINVNGAGTINNSIHRNSIYCNSLRGIVLSNGGNNNYAKPVITASGSDLLVTGPATSFIEVFTLDGCNDCGVNPNSDKLQGRTLVFSGASPFTFTPLAGTTYTATASVANTTAAHNTSEFSICYILCVSAVTPSSVSPISPICVNAGGNITLTANGGAGTSLEWYTGSCAGTAIGTGNGLSIASPIVTTTYYVRWLSTCGSSSCASTTVVVDNLPVDPTSATVDRNNFCSSDAGNVILTAVGGSGTQLEWHSGSCVGPIIGTGNNLSISSPSTTTTYSVKWLSGVCPSSNCADVIVTPISAPTPSIIGVLSSCANTSGIAFSTTDNSGSGNTYLWSSGGGVTITSSNNNAAITSSINSNAGSVTVTETAGTCSTTVSQNIAIIAATSQANAGPNRDVCVSSYSLNGNNPASGAGVWTVASGSGSFSPDANDPNAVVSGLSNGLNQYVWTVTGTCGINDDTVSLMFGASGLNVTAFTTPDTACFGSPKDLNVVTSGTGSGNYSYQWTSSDNSFNLITTTPTVTVNPASALTLYFLTIIDNQNLGCNSGDTVTVHALADQELVVPNLITPNGDTHNDFLEIKDKNELKILPGASLEILNRWGDRVYNNSNYDNTWNATNLSDGVYYFYLKSGCGSRVYKGWVQIIH